MKSKNILSITGAVLMGIMVLAMAQPVASQSSLPLYGNAAAKADNNLTVEAMLTYAIQDEYLARAEYIAIMAKFGQIPPYSNIKEAEEQHIQWLTQMFATLKLTVPVDKAAQYIHAPATLKEAAQAGVQAEIDNIAMYERFLAQPVLKDPRYAAVVELFTRLRDASRNHLEAFQRQLAKY
ncbi:MAG: hypothetical protein QHH01_06135 [Spirochaetales bacterium]|nr:hypothetical protein [Spirochaetales bacterium]